MPTYTRLTYVNTNTHNVHSLHAHTHTTHTHTHKHTSECMKLILPMVFEDLMTMENSGSNLKLDAPSSFESLAPSVKLHVVTTQMTKVLLIVM
jgi:hypothetical protein